MKIKNYSKPILTKENINGYKDDYEFSIAIAESKFVNENISLKIRTTLNSNLLRSLFPNSVSLCIKWKSDFNIECSKFDIFNDEFTIIVDKDKLERTDSIFITAYLVAKDDIDVKNNGEWNEIFEENDIFHFHQNELMAESNTERIDYKSTGEPFVYVVTNENNNGKGLTFDAKKQNHICINVGTDLKDAYTKINIKGKKVAAGGIVDSLFVLNAIVYSLLYIIQEKDVNKFKEKEWFKCIDHCFDDPNYESLESFLNNMIDELNIDIIYQVSQSMIHNAIEQNIIESVRTLQ